MFGHFSIAARSARTMPYSTKSGQAHARVLAGQSIHYKRDRSIETDRAPSRRKKANEVFELGINRRAGPLERLKNRHQQYLQRILVNSSHEIPEDEPLVPSRSGGRSVLGQVNTASSTISGAVQLAPSTRLSKATNGAKMDVFVDGPNKSGQDDEPSEWADYGTRDGRRKENVVEATPWKGETMPQKGLAPRTPKMEVFRDMVRTMLASRMLESLLTT